MSQYYQNSTIEDTVFFGEVTQKKYLFETIERVAPPIKRLKTSCSCSNPKFNQTTGDVTVIYNVPKKRRSALWYSNPYVTVTYQDGSEETLQLRIKIIAK